MFPRVSISLGHISCFLHVFVSKLAVCLCAVEARDEVDKITNMVQLYKVKDVNSRRGH